MKLNSKDNRRTHAHRAEEPSKMAVKFKVNRVSNACGFGWPESWELDDDEEEDKECSLPADDCSAEFEDPFECSLAGWTCGRTDNREDDASPDGIDNPCIVVSDEKPEFGNLDGVESIKWLSLFDLGFAGACVVVWSNSSPLVDAVKPDFGFGAGNACTGTMILGGGLCWSTMGGKGFPAKLEGRVGNEEEAVGVFIGSKPTGGWMTAGGGGLRKCVATNSESYTGEFGLMENECSGIKFENWSKSNGLPVRLVGMVEISARKENNVNKD